MREASCPSFIGEARSRAQLMRQKIWTPKHGMSKESKSFVSNSLCHFILHKLKCATIPLILNLCFLFYLPKKWLKKMPNII